MNGSMTFFLDRCKLTNETTQNYIFEGDTRDCVRFQFRVDGDWFHFESYASHAQLPVILTAAEELAAAVRERMEHLGVKSHEQLEAAEVADLEAGIMAVAEAGLIETPVFPNEATSTFTLGTVWFYRLQTTPRADAAPSVHAFNHETRVEAARAACAWAKALTEKVKWPAIDDMTDTEIVVEIIKRGYVIGCFSGGPRLDRADGETTHFCFSGLDRTLTDALRYARELDGDGEGS